MLAALPDDCVRCIFWWLPLADTIPFSHTCNTFLEICDEYVRGSTSVCYLKTSMTTSYSRFLYAIKQYDGLQRFSVLLHAACFHANMRIIRYLHSIYTHDWGHLCRAEAFHFSNMCYMTRLPSLYHIHRTDHEHIPSPLSEEEIKMFVEIKEPFSCTPLHIAVIMGHANVCAFLLRHASAMPNFIDHPTDDGDTALHLAVKHNRAHIVQLLLRKNANLACKNASTMQPIHFASSRGVLDILVDSKASVTVRTRNDEELLHFAAERGSADILKLLASRGAHLSSCTNQNDLQPIHYACCGRTMTALAVLSEELGVSLETTSANAWRPIHFACHCGNLEAVEYLFTRGCEMLALNADGWTGLTIAVAHAELRVIEFYWAHGLLSQPCQLNARYATLSFSGLNLMHLACLANAKSVVCFLHEKCGLSICCEDQNGCQPIHCAAASGALEVIDYLCAVGADSCATTNDGFSALHYAQALLIACIDQNLIITPREQKAYHDVIRRLLPFHTT